MADTLFSERFPELSAGDDAAIAELLAHAQSVTIPASEFVFHSGTPCQNFLLVLDGVVRVQLTSASGREVTLYRISPGETCILTTSCLLSSDRYPAEAITETEVTAYAMPMSKFQSTLNSSEKFRQFVFDSFSRRLTSVIERIEAVTFTSIDTRLAILLLESHESGKDTTATHQELSVELGTAREVVSRHLKRFEASGWITLARGRISVIDAPALRRVRDASECD